MSGRINCALLLPITAALVYGLTNAATAEISEDDAKQILSIVNPNAATLEALKKKYSVFRRIEAPVTASSKIKTANKNSTIKSVNADPSTMPSSANQEPPPSNNVSSCSGLHFFLRNSWSDLGALGCPTRVDKATGASISYTDDYVARNRNWAAIGMAGAAYSEIDRYYPGVTAGGWFDKSVALYIHDNSSFNSNSKLASKNSDTRTAGLSAELGYAAANNDQQFFRITPSVVQDAIKNTTAVAVMGEYIPSIFSIGLWKDHHLFDDGVNWQFDPDIKFQYASTTDRKNPLQFSGKSQSFRIGTDLTVLVQPFIGGTNDFLDRIGLNTTYHPWYEAYSRRVSYWWTSAVTYRLDDKGYFGVSLNYNRGLDENSGTMTNQYIASLTGKY